MTRRGIGDTNDRKRAPIWNANQFGRRPSHRTNGESVFEQLDAQLCEQDGHFAATVPGLLLQSAFQPIFSLAHRRAVGHEGLLRACRNDGTSVSPALAFATAETDEQSVALDRLCRLIHIRNYLRWGPPQGWIFINVGARAVTGTGPRGSFLDDLLARYHLPAHRLVIEILEGAVEDPAHLEEAVAHFRGHGCLIAIDDFGAGHSNFDRIWSLLPDFVKLDRSMLVRAATSDRIRNLLPHVVALIHECGSLAVMEGIETEDEALIAIDSDVDLVQGFLFGRPQPTPGMEPPGHLSGVCHRFRESSKTLAEHTAETAARDGTFQAALDALRDGAPIALACQALLHLPTILRCYLLDEDGNQAGPNRHPTGRLATRDPRFVPLADARGANWSRRAYFRRAMQHPGSIQITRPYFSIADAGICRTMSATYVRLGKVFVLCCDFAPPGEMVLP